MKYPVTVDISEVDGLQVALDSKANSVHTHAMSSINGLDTALLGKSPIGHNHVIGDMTGLQSALDGKSPIGHSHVIGDMTELQSALDGKSPIGHSHVITDVTGLQTTLNAKASNILWMPFIHNGSIALRLTASSADLTYCFCLPIGATISSLVIVGAVSSLNNSTNYWTWGGVGAPNIRHSNGGTALHTFAVSSFSTQNMAINTAWQIELPINKVASFGFFDFRPAQWVRVGSAGELFFGLGIRYTL